MRRHRSTRGTRRKVTPERDGTILHVDGNAEHADGSMNHCTEEGMSKCETDGTIVHAEDRMNLSAEDSENLRADGTKTLRTEDSANLHADGNAEHVDGMNLCTEDGMNHCTDGGAVRERTFTTAEQLPVEWDALVGDNIYLTRAFLRHTETYDHCGQTYQIFYRDGAADSIVMTYRRKRYNLLMFTKLCVSMSMRFVYVPLSVTRPGAVLGARTQDAAIAAVEAQKGWTMWLNMPTPAPKGYASGLTCPKCVLRVRWKTFDEYIGAMRSNYRRRYRRALADSASLRVRYLEDPVTEFDARLYALYEHVYRKSRIKIEKLPIEFFRHSMFKIFVLEDDAGAKGFVQLLENGKELIFEFVGLDYACQERYDTYHRMLLEIVRYGIMRGVETIDFGQTADEAKRKLGCDYVPLYAWLYHPNRLLRAAAKRLAKRIEYRPDEAAYRVFREDEEER